MRFACVTDDHETHAETHSAGIKKAADPAFPDGSGAFPRSWGRFAIDLKRGTSRFHRGMRSKPRLEKSELGTTTREPRPAASRGSSSNIVESCSEKTTKNTDSEKTTKNPPPVSRN